MTRSPSPDEILRHLADSLDINQTLREYPCLSLNNLQDILLAAAEALKNDTSAINRLQDSLSSESSISTSSSTNKGTNSVIIYVDGASRGNPGDAGAGAVLLDPDGNVVEEVMRYLGRQTNNIAEYSALYLALKRALELSVNKVRAFADSNLMVQQINGRWKVRDERLKKAHGEMLKLIKQFDSFHLTHIGRQFNRKADALANKAIDDWHKKQSS